jgi:hypothetical protein
MKKKTSIKLSVETSIGMLSLTNGFIPFEMMGVERTVDLSFCEVNNIDFNGVIVQNQLNSIRALKVGEKLIIEIGEIS